MKLWHWLNERPEGVDTRLELMLTFGFFLAIFFGFFPVLARICAVLG